MFQKKIMIYLMALLMGSCVTQTEYFLPTPAYEIQRCTDELMVIFNKGVTRAEIDMLIYQLNKSDYAIRIRSAFTPDNFYVIVFNDKMIDVDVMKSLLEKEKIVEEVQYSALLIPVDEFQHTPQPYTPRRFFGGWRK